MFAPIAINFYRLLSFFFFNDTATTEIYTLSLHDALPIWSSHVVVPSLQPGWRLRHRSLGRFRPAAVLCTASGNEFITPVGTVAGEHFVNSSELSRSL